MSKRCGHDAFIHDVPWSDAEECAKCGWHSYETNEQRVVRLQRYAARLREEAAVRAADKLQAECEDLERRLNDAPDTEDW